MGWPSKKITYARIRIVYTTNRNVYACLKTNFVLYLVAHVGTGQVMGWGEKAIEVRSVQTGQLDGVFMHKRVQAFTFLCERNEKVNLYNHKSISSQARPPLGTKRSCKQI